MKIGYLAILAALGLFTASCATQSASTKTTDDIYYSAGDAQAATTVTETTTTTPSSENYSTYPGTSDKYEYAEQPSADNEYRVSGEDLGSETYYDDEGNTYVVNNYYEDDYGYDDYYYTSSIYRFYYPYSGFGYYSYCYSPYYFSPYYDPWGWNIGISFGWGHPCYPYPYYGYYNPYWYDPWYSPYYGYGYGSYWNGYNNGYWNGYYDGYYGYGYGGYPYDYYGGGYYGYNDNNYYYGPNTGTGSNTNTGEPSSSLLSDVYGKTNSSEQPHIVPDKSNLGIGKDEMNLGAINELANTTTSPESVTVKGGLNDGETSSPLAFEQPVVSAPEDKSVVAESEIRDNGSVKVIKYYKAEDAAPAVQTNTSAPVNNSPIVKGTGTMQQSARDIQPEVKPQGAQTGTPATYNFYNRPQINSNQSQGQTQQGTQYDRPQYDKPQVTQPSDGNRNYQQPSKSSNNTYEKPKSDSGSSSRNTWNNNSSSGSSSGSWSGGGYSGSRSSGTSSGGGGSTTKKRGGG